jgi:predicted RNase H-like HicB family nuclease
MTRKSKATRDVPLSPAPYVYRVVIEPDENRYHASIPLLPGCYSWGHTYEEALRNIKEALELWLEVKKEDGEPIPVEDPETVQNAAYTIGVLV